MLNAIIAKQPKRIAQRVGAGSPQTYAPTMRTRAIQLRSPSLPPYTHKPITDKDVMLKPLPVVVSRMNSKFDSDTGDSTLQGWVY